MDKSTRALYASSDNSAAIDALRAELKRGLDVLRAEYKSEFDALREDLKIGSNIKMRVVNGTRSGLTNSFGEVSSQNGAGVIVAFTGASGVLFFNGVERTSGASPLFAALPKVSSELTLTGNCSNARAFIIET